MALDESDLTVRCVINTALGRTSLAGTVEDRSRRRRKASALSAQAYQEYDEDKVEVTMEEENQEKDDLVVIMVEEGRVLFVPHPDLGDQL